MKLVPPPAPAGRLCRFCDGRMTAIELQHDCPERRLALGLYRLRQARLADAL